MNIVATVKSTHVYSGKYVTDYNGKSHKCWGSVWNYNMWIRDQSGKPYSLDHITEHFKNIDIKIPGGSGPDNGQNPGQTWPEAPPPAKIGSHFVDSFGIVSEDNLGAVDQHLWIFDQYFTTSGDTTNPISTVFHCNQYYYHASRATLVK